MENILLLPHNFDAMVTNAIRLFWRTKQQNSMALENSCDDAPYSGEMDGFLHLAQVIVEHCGLPGSFVAPQRKSGLTLPAYFKPTTSWDVLVIHQGRLLAALYFTTQTDLESDTKEALVSAVDFQSAAKYGLYSPKNHIQSAKVADEKSLVDHRQPFVGYLMLLQDCDASTNPTRPDSPHFRLAPNFHDVSYADRYRLLCEKMVSQRLYDAASLLLSEEGSAEDWRTLSEATDVRHLFAMFAGRIAAEVAYSKA